MLFGSFPRVARTRPFKRVATSQIIIVEFNIYRPPNAVARKIYYLRIWNYNAFFLTEQNYNLRKQTDAEYR
uniref:Uncharacterized protein n=1 Tax=Romanomermis culicivorax TaxID=13658 RepID=A0A915JEW8_ROMCU